MSEELSVEIIREQILVFRGQKVMIDRDLAVLYEVETKYLNRQVKRNLERFPPQFMFQLNQEEKKQLVTNWHRFESLKHSSRMPYVFTEHGVAMLASVLKSKRAVLISIHIINVFIKLREMVNTQAALVAKLSKLENKVGTHDKEIKMILMALKQLMNPPEQKREPIGFHPRKG